MDRKRYLELNRDPVAFLTGKEVEEGWHFCNDWDDLLIHRDDPEYQACHCYIDGLHHRDKLYK